MSFCLGFGILSKLKKVWKFDPSKDRRFVTRYGLLQQNQVDERQSKTVLEYCTTCECFVLIDVVDCYFPKVAGAGTTGMRPSLLSITNGS